MGAIRFDKEGNPIGDGKYTHDYSIYTFVDYPQIVSSVSKSDTTESVYVTYFNKENNKQVTVRFSDHNDNGIRFGIYLPGGCNPKEILAKLGLVRVVDKPWGKIPKTTVPKKVRKELIASGFEIGVPPVPTERWGFYRNEDIGTYTGLKGKYTPGAIEMFLSDYIVADNIHGRVDFENWDGTPINNENIIRTYYPGNFN